LQQISRELKININVLKKIEDSLVDDLPNPTSTKGFIKSYAQHLGLNYVSLVEDYNEKLSVNPIDVEQTVLKKAVDPTPFFLSEFIKNRILPICFLAVILILGFAAYRLLNGVDKPPSLKTEIAKNQTASPLKTKSQGIVKAPTFTKPVDIKKVDVEPTSNHKGDNIILSQKDSSGEQEKNNTQSKEKPDSE